MTNLSQIQAKARENFEASPLSLRIRSCDTFAQIHGWEPWIGKPTILDFLDQQIRIAVEEAFAEVMLKSNRLPGRDGYFVILNSWHQTGVDLACSAIQENMSKFLGE